MLAGPSSRTSVVNRTAAASRSFLRFFMTEFSENFGLLNYFRIFFKYYVSCTDGKVWVTIKIEITFNFRLRRRPIQLCWLLWAFRRFCDIICPSRATEETSTTNKTCRRFHKSDEIPTGTNRTN